MKSKREFDDFDDYAENYREIHNQSIKSSGATSDYFSEYKILELLKHEDKNAALRILDYGCGDGNSVRYIKKYFPNAKVVGVDLSVKSIENAQKRKLADTTFISFDGKTLPIDSESIDVVFTSMVFHHIDARFHRGVVSEIYRVLKAGGRYYNFEHNPLNPLTRKVVRECPFDEDAVLLKPSYHKTLIRKGKFKRVQLKFTLFMPRHKFFRPFLNLESLLSWCPIGAQYYIKAIK